MKAEQDFVASLDDTTCKNIQSAISRRIEMKNGVKNHPTPPELPKNSCTSPAQMKQECYNSFSAFTTYVRAQGYNIPAITPEAPPQMGQRNDTMSDLDTARRHMDNRLNRVKSDKREALKTQFGLTYDYPKTYADMKARLLAGKFTLPSDEENEYASLDDLEWRDPAVKKDRPGFEAAEKLLDASATKVKDAIWVKTNPEDALAALEAFESATVN